MTGVRAADVSWITADPALSGTIRYAVPAEYDVYGALDLVGEARANEDGFLDALAPDGSAALIAGWIDRGPWPPPPGDEHVLYTDWRYRFRRVEARELRGLPPEGDDGFPDLLFPPNCSWLVSLLWDDGWRSIGAGAAVARRLDRLPSFERLGSTTSLASTGREPN